MGAPKTGLHTDDASNPLPCKMRRMILIGEVDTLAGQCTHSGDMDGDASEALFSTAIDGIACLSNCSILVADPSSRTVRVITPDGDCPGHPDTTHDNKGTHHGVVTPSSHLMT